MKKVFFNEDGTLNVKTSIENNPVYTKIMEDGYVDMEERAQMYQTIKSKFETLENSLPEEQKALVHELIVDSQIYKAVRDKFNTQVEFDGDFLV